MKRPLALLLGHLLVAGCLAQPPAFDDDDDDDDDDSTEASDGPTVVSTVPSADQAGVAPTVRIEIEFSAPLADSSAAAIRLEGPGGFVNGEPWVEGAFLVLQPAGPLAADTNYSVRVTAEQVEDLDGNSADDDLQFSFTTQPPGLALASSDPWDGELGVEVDRGITLTFSGPIAPSSVNATTMRVMPNRRVDGVDWSTSSLPGSWTVNGAQLSFTPDRGRLQEFNTAYLVDVRGITGPAGEEIWTQLSFETLRVDPAYWYRIKNAAFATMLDTRSGGYTTYLGSVDTTGTFWRFNREGAWLQVRNEFGGDGLFLEGGALGGNSLLTGGGDFTGQQWTLGEVVWTGGVGTNESPVNYTMTCQAQGPSNGLGVILENTDGNHDVGLETIGSLDQEWYLVNAGLR